MGTHGNEPALGMLAPVGLGLLLALYRIIYL